MTSAAACPRSKAASTTARALVAVMLGCAACLAGFAASAADIGFPSVAAARAALAAQPGTEQVEEAGWIHIDLPAAAGGVTRWSFVAPDQPAYPAVVRRDIVPRDGEPTLIVRFLCEGPRAACDALYAQVRRDAGG